MQKTRLFLNILFSILVVLIFAVSIRDFFASLVDRFFPLYNARIADAKDSPVTGNISEDYGDG